MKLKSLILAFAAAALAICSCKEKEEQGGTASITVDGKKNVELTFTNAAETKTVTVVSNREWQLNALSDSVKTWIAVGGVDGKQAATEGKVVTIAVAENTGAQRSAEIVFSNGTKTASVSVTQKTGIAPKTLPYKESFETQGDFTIKNITLPSGFSNIWFAASFGTDKFMKASAYKSSTGYASESWLVSPEINLVGEKSAIMQFDFDQAYGTKEKYAEAFFLYIIKENEEKVKLNVENPTSGQFSSFKTQKFDMADYLGQKIKIAFVYTSEDGKSGASTVEVKNFKIAAKPDSIKTTKIADLFSAEDGSPVTLSGVTIAEVGTECAILSDNADYILVYDSTGFTSAKNDIVTVEGEITTYCGKKQIIKPNVTTTGAGSFVAPAPKDISSEFSSFPTTSAVQYVKFKGVGSVSGEYFNVIVSGESKDGSLITSPNFTYSKYDKKYLEVEGFYVYHSGSGDKHLNVLPSKIDTTFAYLYVDPVEKTVEAKSTQTSFDVKSNGTWSVELPSGVTSDESLISITGDKTITIKYAANTDTENAKTYEIKVIDEASVLDTVVFTLIQKKDGSAITYTYADFETLTSSSSYKSVNTTKGWAITNAAVLTGGTADSNPTFIFIGKSAVDTTKYALAPTINGKTSTIGTITSPSLTGGCGSLKFKYGCAFSGDASAIKFKIEIKQSGAAVKTFTVDEQGLQKTAYEKEYDVDIEGTFSIVITNLCPSSSSSNKDRYSIWNLGWSAYTK